MKYDVFHKDEMEFSIAKLESSRSTFPEGYTKVAEVEAESLSDVYRLTNHITSEWWNNAGVRLIKESRSTSTGDVVVDENGVRNLVKMIGWEII